VDEIVRSPTDVSEEKFILGVIVGVLMVGAWGLTAVFPGLQTNLSTIVGGLTGVYGIFCGGHVTQKWVEGKTADGKDEPELDQDVTMTEEDAVVAAAARRA